MDATIKMAVQGSSLSLKCCSTPSLTPDPWKVHSLQLLYIHEKLCFLWKV